MAWRKDSFKYIHEERVVTIKYTVYLVIHFDNSTVTRHFGIFTDVNNGEVVNKRNPKYSFK